MSSMRPGRRIVVDGERWVYLESGRALHPATGIEVVRRGSVREVWDIVTPVVAYRMSGVIVDYARTMRGAMMNAAIAGRIAGLRTRRATDHAEALEIEAGRAKVRGRLARPLPPPPQRLTISPRTFEECVRAASTVKAVDRAATVAQMVRAALQVAGVDVDRSER